MASENRDSAFRKETMPIGACIVGLAESERVFTRQELPASATAYNKA